MYSPAMLHSRTVQSSDDVRTRLFASTSVMHVTESTCARHHFTTETPQCIMG